MTVVIIDYGMGNLGSIARFFQECGASIKVSDDPKHLCTAEKIVLPGVGSFCSGMNNLTKFGFVDVLRKEVLENNIPLLGVCLGMQLLADTGTEGGICNGLGFVSGKVEKLERTSDLESIPHVGWNEVCIKKQNNIFENIPDKSDFYFVHSYHFIPVDKDVVLASTPYCHEFVSAINYKNIFGVQFHPEKSVPWGFELIKSFLKI